MTLTDEQMSALASGASFESIGIEAKLAAELTAAQAAGDAEEEESGGEQNLDADPEAVAEAARLAAETAKTNMAGSDLTALLDRIQALTVESTTATANLAAMTTQRDKLEAEVKIQEGHVVRLSGIAAQAINRMETALRGTTTDDLDNLEPAALVSKYQNVRDKFEQTFPVGRKTTAVVDKPVTGEQRPRPDTVAEAAQQATKI